MAVFEKKISTNVKLDDTVPLTCTIETSQNVKDHTEYILRVQRGPVPDNSWNVTKRYSDFVTLDGSLRMSNIELPLPPKKVFGNMEREFIAERQTGLQHYINVVLGDPILAQSLFVKRFLDPDNYSMNLQEIALQHISMFFRSEPIWEIVEPLPDIGCRLRKQYFAIKDKNEPKSKYILTWTNLGPDKFLADKDLEYMVKLLPTFQHPYIYSIKFAMSNETSAITIRPFHEAGTLRDLICKSKPKLHYFKKYGKPKVCTACQMSDIRSYGRQLLETLKTLHEKGLPYGHLHAGNIIIEDNRCKLLDTENWLLGLPSHYRSFYTQFKKIQTVEQIEVYSFGQLLYQMTFGEELGAATCDFLPPQCPPEIRSVLESILTTEACKNGVPTITDLLSHPLFAGVYMPNTEKPSIKVPSKLKDSMKEAKISMEKRLKEEQKVINQFRRLSKAQAFHSSEEEKKKRRKSSKKKLSQMNELEPNENGNRSPSPKAPSPTPTKQQQVPAPPPPPPPPSGNGPPPPPPALFQGAAPVVNGSTGSGERGALLGSISGFQKGGLKKVTTVDKSGPKI